MAPGGVTSTLIRLLLPLLATFIEHEVEKKKLTLRIQTLPVVPIVGPDKLKSRPNIRPKPEDIKLILPDYITLRNYKTIDEVPVEVIVNRIEGSIEWK